MKSARLETSDRIQVRLRELAQLFNSMDPSPLSERDLDADAEEFIVSWASEFAPAGEFELVIHLTEPPPPRRAAAVEDAVPHFFRERAAMKRLELRRLLRQGRVSLLVGLVFLLICLTLGQLIGSFFSGADRSGRARRLPLDLVRGSRCSSWPRLSPSCGSASCAAA